MLLSDAAARRSTAPLFGQFGPQGKTLFDSFMQAVRQSLSTAVVDLFLLATIVAVVGLVVVLFLNEVPLRRTHMTLEEAELLAAEAEAGATGGQTPQGSGAEGGQAPFITGRPPEPDAEG